MLEPKDLGAKFAADKGYFSVVQLLHELSGIDVELRVGREGFNNAEPCTLPSATLWPVCCQFPVNVIAWVPEQVARVNMSFERHRLTKILKPPAKHRRGDSSEDVVLDGELKLACREYRMRCLRRGDRLHLADVGALGRQR